LEPSSQIPPSGFGSTAVPMTETEKKKLKDRERQIAREKFQLRYNQDAAAKK